jgi:hypothetical protein
MFDTIGVIILLVLAALAAWLAGKSRRAKNGAVKWVGMVLSSVVAAALVLVVCVVVVGFYRVNFPRYRASAADVKIVATPERLARGEKFAKVCAGCHSPDGKPPSSGGISSKATLHQPARSTRRISRRPARSRIGRTAK